LIDLCFLVDIFVIFFSAYHDEEVGIVDSRSEINKNYLKGWFMIDVLTIIPFDTVFEYSTYNKIARVARVGRLYKLVKLTKLFRFLKIMKEKNKLMKFFT